MTLLDVIAAAIIGGILGYTAGAWRATAQCTRVLERIAADVQR